MSEKKETTINDLPSELLEDVLLYLPPADRLISALTSRRWAEALSSSTLLRDIRLNLAGFEIERATPVLFRSHRQYRSLQLHRANLSQYNSQFWEKISRNLRELEFIECDWLPQVFFAILRQCSRLETLKLDQGNQSRAAIKNTEIPENCCPEELRESLKYLRHLEVHISLSRESFHQLLGLMPNVTSLSLSKFDEGTDHLEHLPNIITANRRLTKLDFSSAFLVDAELIWFLRIAADSLLELRMECGDLTSEAYAALSCCTELRKLSLYGFPELEDEHLKELVAKAPNLETLELAGCETLTEEGYAQIFKLEKLRRLSFGGRDGFTRRFMRNLGKFPKLEFLDMKSSFVSKVDNKVFRSMASLTNLQTLSLGFADLNSECLGIICDNFKRLRELDLGSIERLTDADCVKLRHLKELVSLNFTEAVKLTDLTFKEGVGSTFMKTLTVESCPLTDEGLVSIAAHHGRLRELNLVCCGKITQTGLVHLLRSEPLLEKLGVEYVSVGNGWLGALEELCPRLRVLDVSSGTSLTAVKRFVLRRPSVVCRHEHIQIRSVELGSSEVLH